MMNKPMGKKTGKSLAACLFCGIAGTGHGAELPVYLDQNNLRFTYESVTLPGNESMGLVGMNYQLSVGSYGYGGLGVYGAAAGERGGFFVGGFEGGVRYPFLSGFEAEAGMFVGGGGGGAAPQGGGLMLRPHVGLTYGTDTLRAGVQLSRVEFPDGEIKSTQLSGVVDIPFESFRLDGGYHGRLDRLPFAISETLKRSLNPVQGTFGVEVQRYTPLGGSLRTDDTPLVEAFETVGVRYENFLTRHTVWHATTAGAMGGSADGYAEIFTGLGYRYGVFDSATTKSRLFLTADGAVGMAGGGRIKTGGGTMGKGSVGMSYLLGPEWKLDARAGYVRAADGDFAARTVTVSLNRAWAAFSPARTGGGGSVYGDLIERSDWQIRPLHETYTSAARKEGSARAVSLVGMQIDALSGGSAYVYGKALGAYGGGAGGYASGTVGIGMATPFFSLGRWYLQGGAGAAGGGGIDVAGGAIAEAETGVLVKLFRNTDLLVGGGVIRSFSGELESPAVKLGLSYRFATLGRRPRLY